MITLAHCDFATRFLLYCLSEGRIDQATYEEWMRSVRCHERRLTRASMGRRRAAATIRLRQRARVQEAVDG